MHKIFISLSLVFGFSSAMAVPDTIRISSRLDPNAILITEVDIVFVYDAELAASFPPTKAAWYSGKFMFTRNAGNKIDVVNTFVPQGFDAVSPPLPERKNQALRVLVFGQHDASETEAIDITDMERVLIEIDPFGILVSDSE